MTQTKLQGKYSWQALLLPITCSITGIVILVLDFITPSDLSFFDVILGLFSLISIYLIWFFSRTFSVTIHENRIYFRGRPLRSSANIRNVKRTSQTCLQLYFNFLYIVQVVGQPDDIDSLQRRL